MSSVRAVVAAILPVSDSAPGRGRDVYEHGSIHDSNAQPIVLGVSSCLPLQIQKWFGPQSDVILCCVVRGLVPLADHSF